MLTITLDWLAFTFKVYTHEAAVWIQLFASATDSMESAPTNGYRAAYTTTEGVSVMWNLDRPEMGYHVIISGSAIRNIVEKSDMDQKTLLQSVCDAGASITRLDLAKDLTGENVSLDKIYQALERKESVGTARTFSQIHSINGGNTVYVGSRQSEKFIRIYDKAAQSQLPGKLWFRFELETKGMVARALASLLTQEATWDGAFDRLARDMVDLPQSKDYKAFYASGIVEIGIPKLEKKTDREAWIEAQVIPAVLKHYTDNPNSKAIARLRDLLDLIDSPRTDDHLTDV